MPRRCVQNGAGNIASLTEQAMSFERLKQVRSLVEMLALLVHSGEGPQAAVGTAAIGTNFSACAQRIGFGLSQGADLRSDRNSELKT